jgi:hypothetical protein
MRRGFAVSSQHLGGKNVVTKATLPVSNATDLFEAARDLFETALIQKA